VRFPRSLIPGYLLMEALQLGMDDKKARSLLCQLALTADTR
jgi:hypothetical protein